MSFGYLVIQFNQMTKPSSKPPKRKLTSLELSDSARGALRRIKSKHGLPFTVSIQKGVAMLEKHMEATA